MTPALTGSAFVSNAIMRFGFMIVFLAFFVLFAAWNPVFLQGGNLSNIIEGSAVLMIVALGMTLVVATGGIDLSVGIALDFGAAFVGCASRTKHLHYLIGHQL